MAVPALWAHAHTYLHTQLQHLERMETFKGIIKYMHVAGAFRFTHVKLKSRIIGKCALIFMCSWRQKRLNVQDVK